MEEQKIVAISKIAAEAAAAVVLKSSAEAAAAAATMAASIEYIKKDIAAINEKLDNKYVTKDEFVPVRAIVYGLVGLIMVGVVGALIALVVITKPAT